MTLRRVDGARRGASRASGGVGRPWLQRVLRVVRELGAARDPQEVLQGIADAVVEVLEFGAAAINLVEPDGTVRTAAVAGPAELDTELLGRVGPLSEWTALLASAERWGELRFLSHRVDIEQWRAVPTWVPAGPEPADEEAWHPDDALLAPMTSPDGTLLGVISVDQPRSGRRPDAEQRTVLELFAEQAARSLFEAAARSRAEALRREAEQRWQLAFEHSPVGAAIVNADGTLAKVNDAFAAMLGLRTDQLTGKSFVDLTHPHDRATNVELFEQLVRGERSSYQLEKRYRHADRHVVWASLHVGAIVDDSGRLVSIVSQANDITDRKDAEQRLAHRAVHDPLTNLPNRVRLEERLAELLGAGVRSGVLLFGIDRFKTVNDSLGHDAGDSLLRSVADRIRRFLPQADLVGRLGGDEFVAIVPGGHDPEELRRLAVRTSAAVRRPVRIRGHRHVVGLSVGITVSGPGHQHPDEVLRESEQALRRAKRNGRGRIEVYDPLQDRHATVEDLDLENDLRAAVHNGVGLVPYFQRIVDLGTNAAVGYEALVRWRHPRRGLLPPSAFLPLAEQTGLIVPLGWWMLGEGCRLAGRAELTDGWSRWVAVNVSASQLGQDQLLPAVRRALDEYQLPAERLHIEITETALANAGPSAIKEVNRVADLGVHVALDDFGTGYSSLSLLRDLPVSTVKIDRSFVEPITEDPTAMAIVRSVIALCRELGITTVGEGVETQDQLTALRALGCAQAQGYLLGRPAPALG